MLLKLHIMPLCHILKWHLVQLFTNVVIWANYLVQHGSSVEKKDG